MPDINYNQYINPIELASYWDNTLEQRNLANLISPTLFPAIQVMGLNISWFKGASNVPLGLQPSAFDVKATVRGRISMEKVASELPYFKEYMILEERDRQALLQAMSSGNNAAVNMMLANIYRDQAQLIAGALVQRERMACQVITNAAIDVRSNHASGHQVDLIYNYDPSGNWNTNNKRTLTGAEEWTVANAATSTPIDDIQEVLDTGIDNGVTIFEAIMTTPTFRGMLASDQVREYAQAGGVQLMTNQNLQQFVETTLGIRIRLHDAVFRRSEDGNVEKYFPDGTVSFVPAGALGQMVFGTTPAQADLMAGTAAADSVSIVDTGVAVYTRTTVDPVNVQTFAAQVVLPVCQQIDRIYVLDVFTP